MKKCGRIVGILVVISLLLGGCGTPLHEMTAEEETLIAQYAAYALAKHNTFQKDGIAALDPKLLEEIQKPGTQPGGNGGSGGSQGGNGSEGKPPGGEISDIAGAMGLSGKLKVTYGGYSVADHYKEGKYYSMDAKAGKVFVILKFTVENVSSEAVEINNNMLDVNYLGCFDGKNRMREESAILLYGLSTYKGTLAAGDQVNLVLIYQISEEKAQNMTGVSLFIQSGKDVYPINL